MQKIKLLYIFIALQLCNIFANAQSANIYKFRIDKNINSTTWLYTKEALAEANNDSTDLIILHLNTYGGEVTFADSIRTAILNSPIPVVVFIDNNAASAGALISIACDRIYMRPGGSIGAATVVNGTDGSQAPDKYQSYMRATMRATAESHGKDSLGRWVRDPLIAEAMVDDQVIIENIIDSGKTLTFTSEEALTNRYCEAIVESIEQIIELEGYTPSECTISEYRPTAYDNIKGWLMSTALQSILIMVIIGGIYFELQTPGVGFPIIASITAATLYFAPLYIDGLAANWEIILFVIGIILLILEMFVIPGFGVAGICGIICTIAGLGFSMVGNVYFDFSGVTVPEMNGALLSLFIGLILGFVIIIWLSSKIGTKGAWSRLALQTTQQESEGYIGVPTEQLTMTGARGIATTDLRPSGKVEINGKQYDAVARRGYIQKGSNIKVQQYNTGQLIVTEDVDYNAQ
ncbi:MAG: NfeD family protein [bacterium]